MDKQAVFAQVANVEERIGELYAEVGSLKRKIVELIEENQKLAMENATLRKILDEMRRETEHVHPGDAYDNLARIYQDGFHICHVRFGSLRTDGDCLFCLSLLNKTG
ncbi:MAG: DNA replication initiation control protein YabA [Alicyclobacillaceae bacterium]|nr:DNA replication initiation control protein YabA [Alicyclobacillaceae bacterium]